MTPVLITAAAVIAAMAAFRAVMLGSDLDDANAERLSHALVVHGTAVIALGVIVVIGAGLPWTLDVPIAALTLAWGGTLVLVGRAYEPSEERLAAQIRDERPSRAQPVQARFGGAARERELERERERIRRSTQT